MARHKLTDSVTGLKLRYATCLLGVMILIGGSSMAAVRFCLDGDYLLMCLVLGALYPATFFLGRKLEKMFFVLALIKFLRNNGGTMPVAACRTFIAQRKKTARQQTGERAFGDEIVELLMAENIASLSGENLILVPR
ncbi:hypothetical protein [Desulforhopalus singaporensis]|uniref:Uncharacterized protein n=1 Tax=Desulforhopalus singaporensis TaxID=91360 RepID=A0A1H0JX05_9BACT|nr:hypothetical protein [Desulforhopalus singaporensis]SDO47921.1 hypothetical protein SAMN05660330_00349 [Desulforhopalus singaporensis]